MHMAVQDTYQTELWNALSEQDYEQYAKLFTLLNQLLDEAVYRLSLYYFRDAFASALKAANLSAEIVSLIGKARSQMQSVLSCQMVGLIVSRQCVLIRLD
jgi:hypothetical protein